ncbi:uncharacterized protein LOC143514472 [Brachyhypopomus gauderio]|uniref:uncharacterized protein LOC143514472 n=1 Tax=Brachyhypopomus gauderio TaxID=698409 RepID=UPI004041C39B
MGAIIHFGFKLSAPRRVKLYEGDVPIVDLSLAEGERKVQVSLWREAALNTIHIGHPVTITHLRWTNDKSVGFKWNSTSHTTIKETEEGPRTEVLKIIGVV